MQQPDKPLLKYPTIFGRTPCSTLKVSAIGLLITALLASFPSFAGQADIIDGKITALGDNRYRIDATVRHADTGWEHYADRWDVTTEDGTVIGARKLAHPHENEQPFTRSLTLTIPPDTKKIILQAHDSVHGLGGAVFEMNVPAP